MDLFDKIINTNITISQNERYIRLANEMKRKRANYSTYNFKPRASRRKILPHGVRHGRCASTPKAPARANSSTSS